MAFVSPPSIAEGLTVDTTTAKPNRSDGDGVVGGVPTRITWKAVVDEGEEISQIDLVLPAGSTFDDRTSVEVAVLDSEGVQLKNPCQDILTIEQVSILFEEPVTSGNTIRVFIHFVALPAEGGDFTITGSFVDGEGIEHELDESPTISVIGLTTTEKIIEWLDGQAWVEDWNSITFLKVFLNPQVIVASVPNLFVGWLRSLGLVMIGFPLAIPIGLGVSFLRMSKIGVLRFISSIYVNVIRGTPLFLQIYVAFYGLPYLGIKIDDYMLGIIVLAINSSAYMSEIFRAGIQSIPKGQFEASSSLGMNRIQTMFSVIIPQTVRRIIPTATSEFILLYKDTALLAAVGVMEQMSFAKSTVATTGNMTPYIVAACYYLIVTLPLTKVIGTFEKKLANAETGGSSTESNKKKRKRRKKDESVVIAEGITANKESLMHESTSSHDFPKDEERGGSSG